MRIPALLVFIGLFPLTSSAAGFVGGIKAETGIWDTGIDGNAVGASVGPNIAYSYDRYFGAFGFMMGNFKNSSEGASFGRNEWELTAGYRLLPLASLFGGIKQTFIDYSNSKTDLSFNDRITTVGGGAAIFYPLTRQLIALASVSIDIPFSSYESSSQNVSGNGLGTAGEVGVSYRFAKKTSMNARFKGQSQVLNYDATKSSWNTNVWKLGLDLTHVF